MSAVVKTPIGSAARQPLVVGNGDRTVALDGRQRMDLETFLAQVRGVAAILPAGQHAVNLCEDRYRFLVAFCAVALRGQVTLMPPSRAPEVVTDVLAQYPESYSLGDGLLAAVPSDHWTLPELLPELQGDVPMIDEAAVVAIGFTSGSTGSPKPNPKTWSAFRASTGQNRAALESLWQGYAMPHVVATVPPQHMYGMELSVLLPLLGPAGLHTGRPFFPEDVSRVLAETPEPRLLATTPVHLRALVESGVELPPLCGIVSATAPLSQELAAAAEARFGCEVREVFGSTETCVIARRRTAREAAWTPLPGVHVHPKPDGTLIYAAHLPLPVALADLVELESDGRFHLRGRQADLLEIAGKRASLGDLTRRLLAIPGVVDGVMLQLDAAGDRGVARVAALVVAPDLEEAAILAALRESIDPVFLPRPLKRVPALPRSETGKLPRAELLKLL
ncbi:AMP-binding protein [Pseudoxanthomonas sacheonensis]|uniref:Acyl-coenzyme A synthetase/AMP-(Fatty) acid ligase n=1 Tax=Pseudoxanthomonas sacheonensis TaxID=443615 RepID=A0ABU1RTP4_9GAMM|nr:AMP-binding protein [Pseudoxanthomonas sacheonensis]MDR6841977.1 acyl-coenzyme A synthetase/AMP-(fatty) acid ligase [Pseudoxanthomonas sacheonensis]